jgi:hypothetical protein
MDKLHEYGGRIIMIDGRRVVEMRDPNDNARTRYQYRLSTNGALEARRNDGPWETRTATELAELRRQRGQYHPILDELGLAS